MKRPRLPLRLAPLLLATSACAPVPLPPAPPAPPALPAPPDLSIPERLSVFAAGSRANVTPRWEIWQGTRWPAGKPAIGLFSRAARRFEHIVPAQGVVVASTGAVLILGARPQLFPASGAAPVVLPGPLKSASFSPDGARLLGAEPQDFVLLDANTGREIARRPTERTPAAEVVEWRDDVLLVGEHGDHRVLRVPDLSPILDGVTGPLSPDGTRMFDAPFPANTLGNAPRARHVALRILDVRTGKVLHEQRGERPGYDGTGRLEVTWSADGRRISWLSDRFHVLDLQTKRLISVAWPRFGEGDAEARLAAAVTADGARACFATNGQDASYDLRRRAWLRDRSDRAFRCDVSRDLAHVVEVPLRPGEEVIDLPVRGFGSWPDMVLSKDRSRAAVLVAARAASAPEHRPVALLIVELAGQRVVHRVELGRVASPTMERSSDGLAVDVEVVPEGSEWERRRVSFSTGAVAPAPPEQEPPPPPPEPAPPFAMHEAGALVRGATVLWSGPERTVAYRLDGAAAPIVIAGAPCLNALSPQGWAFLRLCGEPGAVGSLGGEIASLRGEPMRRAPAQQALHALALADDGTLAVASGQQLEINEGGALRWIELDQGRGSITALAWSPEGDRLAAWHAGDRVLHLIDRGAKRPRWSRPLGAGRVRELRFSDDGREVIVDEKEAFPVDGTTPARKWVAPERPREPLEPGWVDDVPVGLPGGALLATTHRTGVVRLHDAASGATMATLVPLVSGSAVALFADGRVDWLGEPVASPDVVCMVDAELAAPERCMPLVDRGALRRAVAPAR